MILPTWIYKREEVLFKRLSRSKSLKKFTSIPRFAWYRNTGDLTGLQRCRSTGFGEDKWKKVISIELIDSKYIEDNASDFVPFAL